MALLASVYVSFGEVPLIAALFLGVKAAVIVIVVDALLRVSRRALRGLGDWAIAFVAFVAIFFFAVPFPIIIFFAAFLGVIFFSGTVAQPGDSSPGVPLRSTVVTAAIWLAIWWLPVALLGLLVGHDFLLDIGLFFSRLAVVTFGGAYAVLAYLGQDVVVNFGWLTAGEMMDGLGLAETTPGPLILVTEFVGFLAGYQQAGWGMALAAAALVFGIGDSGQ